MIDYVGENTTRAILKRNFRALAIKAVFWLLVGALLPVMIVWSV
jgi:hypothetical protein